MHKLYDHLNNLHIYLMIKAFTSKWFYKCIEIHWSIREMFTLPYSCVNRIYQKVCVLLRVLCVCESDWRRGMSVHQHLRVLQVLSCPSHHGLSADRIGVSWRERHKNTKMIILNYIGISALGLQMQNSKGDKEEKRGEKMWKLLIKLKLILLIYLIRNGKNKPINQRHLSSKRFLTAVGFEPTPPKRLEP